MSPSNEQYDIASVSILGAMFIMDAGSTSDVLFSVLGTTTSWMASTSDEMLLSLAGMVRCAGIDDDSSDDDEPTWRGCGCDGDDTGMICSLVDTVISTGE